MRSFEDIYAMAVQRRGDPGALESELPCPQPPEVLRSMTDDRYLAAMTKRVFQAGFVWRVVENKWPGFEAAFDGFNPLRFATLPEDALRPIAADTRVIRNWSKIRTVKPNAEMIVEASDQHGSFGAMIADWPGPEFVSLWSYLKKNGSRLGGNSGPIFLRMVGKDTPILTPDVVSALCREGVVTKVPTSKRDLDRVQSAFNAWADQGGRPLCQVSKVLAVSIS